MKTQRWRVLIIDDHALSRAVAAEAVGSEGGAVVGDGNRVEDAVCLVDKHRPDVLLLAVGLVKPLRGADLGPALDVAVTHFSELEVVRKENEVLRRKLESRKLVDRAKGLLMTRLGMNEPEAFRRIQKTAMDTRVTMAEVAQALLHTDGMGPLRPAR